MKTIKIKDEDGSTLELPVLVDLNRDGYFVPKANIMDDGYLDNIEYSLVHSLYYDEYFYYGEDDTTRDIKEVIVDLNNYKNKKG